MPEYIPFIARCNSDGIRENVIYVRRGTSTEEANYEELQEIINRRLETGYSSSEELDLSKHLAELHALYNQIPRYVGIAEIMEDSLGSFTGQVNHSYPKEDFDVFVARMIRDKKEIISDIVHRK